jgi:hypothetical protein
VQGAELSALWRPYDALEIGAAIMALDTEIEQTTDAPGGTNVATFDGKPLPFASDLSATLHARHEWTLPGDMQLALEMNAKHQGEYFLDAEGRADRRQGPITLLDAAARLRLSAGTELSLWGRNLLDEDYALSGYGFIGYDTFRSQPPPGASRCGWTGRVVARAWQQHASGLWRTGSVRPILRAWRNPPPEPPRNPPGNQASLRPRRPPLLTSAGRASAKRPWPSSRRRRRRPSPSLKRRTSGRPTVRSGTGTSSKAAGSSASPPTTNPPATSRRRIADLVQGVKDNELDQVLLGVTGSGKTFTMAKVIEAVQRPALILAHNKTLAAQLYGEFKSFFPDNAVEYFVSYYDYYMPEAYVPRTDTYIEKESSINEAIDRMRHSATRAILERDDVIIVASVSCIYGIGSVETYTAMTFELEQGQAIDPRQVAADLVALQYKRNDQAFGEAPFG